MGILSSLPADVNRLDRAEKGEGQRFLILQWREIPAIINTKNKNAAARGCSNTRKPAQVPIHLHNGPRAAPHGILYDIPALHARGGFCRFISVPVCMRLVLALCGVILHGVFVFHPADRLGASCPRAAAVECNTAGAGVRGPAPWKREDLEGFPEKSEKGESLCLL